METDCILKTIGHHFFKFTLMSSRNQYKLITFCSPFKKSPCIFFLETGSLTFHLTRRLTARHRNTSDIIIDAFKLECKKNPLTEYN